MSGELYEMKREDRRASNAFFVASKDEKQGASTDIKTFTETQMISKGRSAGPFIPQVRISTSQGM